MSVVSIALCGLVPATRRRINTGIPSSIGVANAMAFTMHVKEWVATSFTMLLSIPNRCFVRMIEDGHACALELSSCVLSVDAGSSLLSQLMHACSASASYRYAHLIGSEEGLSLAKVGSQEQVLPATTRRSPCQPLWGLLLFGLAPAHA